MTDAAPVTIRFQDVVQRFRVIHNRALTLRQAFAGVFRDRTTVHDFEALKRISFQVRAGETLGIIGRNGSGKSTILKIIAGVFRPSQGCVEVNGSVSPLIELGAGFHPELTGRENAILAGALMGIEPAVMQTRLGPILAFSELEDFFDVPVKQYSSGMFARLGFAVATEIDPQILLVDEVLAVGDWAFQQKCFERMVSFRRRAKTTVFVSHDMPTVEAVCDRVLLIDHGQLLAEGPAEAVIARYRALLQPPSPGSPPA